MDLRTTWLGMELPHPLMVGASPVATDMDLARRAEDAGASAIVMPSLFEEQILLERATHAAVSSHSDSFAEAGSYLPEPGDYLLGPDAYLDQIRKLKSSLGIPVVASLNGMTDSGWVHHAKLIEQAGADALELNVYSVPHEALRSAEDVESETVRMIAHVVRETKLPVSVKLSPFWTSLAHLSRRIETAGARGLVLFNRYYQPDIDVEELAVSLQLRFSDPTELPLRLRWLALLSARLDSRTSLTASGGVHSGLDALKAVMAGAHGVQLVSAVLKHGPERIRTTRDEMSRWLVEHEYESLRQAQGSLNMARCPNPEAYERGNYVKILQGYSRAWS